MSSVLPIRIPLLVFTDVDGTLLERGSVPDRWPRTRNALADALVVLASSRTWSELVELQEMLGIRGPIIAENGAVLGVPNKWHEVLPGASPSSDASLRMVALGTPRSMLARSVRRAAQYANLPIHTTGEVSPEIDRKVPGITLLLDSGTRHRSLLLQTGGSRAAVLAFTRSLGRASLTLTDGGRWQVVQGGSSKGLAANVLLNMLRQEELTVGHVVAVGDGENDRSLLQVAETPFAIRRSDGTLHPALSSLPHRLVPRQTGPDGWADIVEVLVGQQEESIHA